MRSSTPLAKARETRSLTTLSPRTLAASHCGAPPPSRRRRPRWCLRAERMQTLWSVLPCPSTRCAAAATRRAATAHHGGQRRRAHRRERRFRRHIARAHLEAFQRPHCGRSERHHAERARSRCAPRSAAPCNGSHPHEEKSSARGASSAQRAPPGQLSSFERSSSKTAAPTRGRLRTHGRPTRESLRTARSR